MDDLVAVDEDESDLLITNAICRQFEEVSGAIINRSHKTAVLGLGGGAGHNVWPLSWVGAPAQLKTFGITFAPPPFPSPSAFPGRTAWDESGEPSMPGGKKGCISLESGGGPGGPQLQQVVVHGPDTPAPPAGGQQCHVYHRLLPVGRPLGEASLARASQSEANAWPQSLLHHLQGVGPSCQTAVPTGGSGRHPGCASGLLARAGCWLLRPQPGCGIPLPLATCTLGGVGGGSGRDLCHGTVHPNHLGRPLLLASMRPFWTPPSKVEYQWPFAWHLVWKRLWLSNLSPLMVDRYFLLLHNILPLRSRLVGFGMVVDCPCGHCGGLKTCSISFSTAQWWPTLWDGLYFRLVGLMPRLPSDHMLLMLAFPRFRWLWRAWWWPIWESSWLSCGSLVAFFACPPG